MHTTNRFLTLILILVFTSFISCETDLDDETIESLLTGTDQNIESVERIAKEDTLYSYLTLVSGDSDTELTDVGCIQFIYPFVLFRYDETGNFANQVSVLGNENFASILEELEDNYSIGLSYPISGNLIDGTSVTVENNEQLQQSLETCIEAQLEIIIERSYGIATAGECIWKITQSDAEESPYIDSFFTLRDDGSVVFSVLQPNEEEEEEEENDEEEQLSQFKTEVGTWIFYYIGADLHMNINFGPIEENEELTETESIKADWNFDWKIISITSENIEIEKTFTEVVSTETGEEEKTFTEKITLEKECEDE